MSKVAEYFKESAEKDWKTAKGLFNKVKRYDACLFFCHLVLEKSLKYLIIQKTGKLPPHSHKLLRLAKLAGLAPDENQSLKLNEINSFNIACRYDDDKFSFYKKCTVKYAEKYLAITRELYLWVKKSYREK